MTSQGEIASMRRRLSWRAGERRACARLDRDDCEGLLCRESLLDLAARESGLFCPELLAARRAAAARESGLFWPESLVGSAERGAVAARDPGLLCPESLDDFGERRVAEDRDRRGPFCPERLDGSERRALADRGSGYSGLRTGLARSAHEERTSSAASLVAVSARFKGCSSR